MKLLRPPYPADQQVVERPPLEPGGPHGLSRVARHQQPRSAPAGAGDGAAELHHDRGLEQRQVLDLVDDDTVESLESLRHLIAAQPFDGLCCGDEFGEDLPDPRAVSHEGLGNSQQRPGSPLADSAVVVPQSGVRLIVQTGDTVIGGAFVVARNRPAEEDAAQLGVERMRPSGPGPRVAPEPGEHLVELRAAGPQRLSRDVGAADLAEERREIAGDHLDVDRRERCETLLGVLREGTRPREIQHALVAPGLHRLPEHRRLAGSRAAQNEADRAVVVDEVDLLVRPGAAGDILDQLVRRRQVQVVTNGTRRERGVVVVMSDVPHQDGVTRQVERPGRRATVRRPPQVVLHAVVAAQR